MGHINKVPKGEISIINHRGKIRLRWRQLGIRYQLSPPYDYSTENLHKTNVIIAEIKLDIMKGYFDTSLEKYKPVNSAKRTKKEPVPVPLPEPIEIKHFYLHELAAKFNDRGNNIRNIDVANSDYSR